MYLYILSYSRVINTEFSMRMDYNSSVIHRLMNYTTAHIEMVLMLGENVQTHNDFNFSKNSLNMPSYSMHVSALIHLLLKYFWRCQICTACFLYKAYQFD